MLATIYVFGFTKFIFSTNISFKSKFQQIVRFKLIRQNTETTMFIRGFQKIIRINRAVIRVSPFNIFALFQNVIVKKKNLKFFFQVNLKFFKKLTK